jgi:hypothetical protein
LGDVNSDQYINVLDVVILIDYILNMEFNENGDINSDGVLNVLDVVDLINIILE